MRDRFFAPGRPGRGVQGLRVRFGTRTAPQRVRCVLVLRVPVLPCRIVSPPNRTRWQRGVRIASQTLLAGCSAVESPEGIDNLEIVNWWAGPGEKEAMAALVQLHERKHPETKVSNIRVASATEAREALARRLTSNRSPDSFQSNIGADLGHWVLLNQRDTEESRLESLTPLAARHGWDQVFAPQLLSQASYDGHLYGLPLSIHRENTLFYNRELFAEVGLTPPHSWEELRTACEVFAKDDSPAIGLSLGAEIPWPLGLLFFENLLLGVTDKDYYQRYLTGERPGSERPRASGGPDQEMDAPIIEALERFEALLACANDDFRATSWSESVRRVAAGEAAMTVMGDWARGLVRTEFGDTDSFQVLPFPGTSDYFVYTADTFNLPKGARHPAAAEAWLQTIASPEGQRTFNRIKGSIPTRNDAKPSDYDQATREVMHDFSEAVANDKLVLAVSGFAPGAFVDPINVALAEFASDAKDHNRHASADKSIVTFALHNYYDVLIDTAALSQ